MFLGCGGLSALQEVGAVALDLGGCPLDLGAAALKLIESLIALCEPVAGRLLVSQSRLLMTRKDGVSHASHVPALACKHTAPRTSRWSGSDAKSGSWSRKKLASISETPEASAVRASPKISAYAACRGEPTPRRPPPPRSHTRIP